MKSSSSVKSSSTPDIDLDFDLVFDLNPSYNLDLDQGLNENKLLKISPRHPENPEIHLAS